MKSNGIKPELLISETELASLAGITARRVRQLCMEGKLPRQTEGLLPAREAIGRLIAYYRSDSEEMRAQKLRKVTLEADEAEMRRDYAGHKLVPLEFWLRFHTTLAVEIRQAIEDSPEIPENIRKIIARKIVKAASDFDPAKIIKENELQAWGKFGALDSDDDRDAHRELDEAHASLAKSYADLEAREEKLRKDQQAFADKTWPYWKAASEGTV
jgi:hypothetical protein